MTPPPHRGREARPGTHDAAVISQVLDALLLTTSGDHAVPAGAGEVQSEQALPPGVADLIARAVAEVNRDHGTTRLWGNAAPVLGSGVVQGLIAARRRGPVTPVPPDESKHVDQRL